MRTINLFTTAILSFVFVGGGQAATLWTNNAGTPFVQSFDTVTGVKDADFIASGSNGRGVVVVGDVVYTTDAFTGNVGAFDKNTGAPVAGGFTIPGVTGISTITFDGDNFWISDYTGANNAYYVSPTGVILDTIQLSESVGFYDGLEYFNGKLIANEFDGGFTGGNRYSVYDLDGNLLIEDFIDTTGNGNGTGIAFDGENFYISDIFNGRATIWSGLDGSFLGSLTLLGSTNVIEDLSFDFESRPDTCRVNCEPSEIPEPGSVGLFGSGILLAALWLRRRKAGFKS